MGRQKSRRKVEEPVNFWHTFLFKFGSRLLLAVAVIVVFLTLAQCTVKKPESPEWNTTFVVPIVNKTYDMEELVSRIDQDEIYIDTSGDVACSIEQDLDTVQLSEDDLSVPDLAYTLSEVLGSIRIETPSDEIFNVSLDSLAGGLLTVPGFDTIIVPANTSFSANNYKSLESFGWADVSSGNMRIIVTNRLGLTLYDVDLELYDLRNAVLIDAGTFAAPLAHDGIDSMTISLAGKTVSDSLRLTVTGHSDPVSEVRVAPAGKEITTEITFPDDIEVTAAMAEVPALDDLDFSQRMGLDLDASETIDSAILESGSLDISVTNNTSLPTSLTISVPSLAEGGTPLVINRQLVAGENLVINNDLAGYTLTPVNDSVDIDVTASIAGSGGQQVLVQDTDSINVDAALSSLSFNSVTGVFANSVADFDNIHEDLDVPDGFDNISLVTAILTLEVENGVDMPGYMDVQITGSNGKVLNISGDIEARGLATSRVSTIVNDQVADFLSPIPEAIDISGSVQFGDGSYHGTVTRDDFVFANVRIYAPLEVKVNNAEITDLEVEAEDIDQEDMDYITEHVISARFVYTVANHLPLGVTALVHLSGDSASLYTNPELSIDTLLAEPAPVSLATGIATSEAITSGEIYLDNDDVQILKNDMLYIRQQLFLTASDTSGVKLTENDYITINGRIEVEYRFDGDF